MIYIVWEEALPKRRHSLPSLVGKFLVPYASVVFRVRMVVAARKIMLCLVSK